MARRVGLASIFVFGSFALPAMLYWFSVEPGVGSWDVGEMQTVLYILGIAHTTGYPAFVLAGWIFSHAFAIGGVAWRINLLGALYFAGASCTLCCIQTRLGVRPAIALLDRWYLRPARSFGTTQSASTCCRWPCCSPH
jgi:hypothetical protein